MHAICVPCVFLSLALLGQSLAAPCWIDSLTEYISSKTSARQVILMSSLSPNERFRSQAIDKLIAKIAEKIPIVYMNVVAEPRDPLDVPPDIKIDDHSGFGDTSTTFFIFIHESHESLGVLPPSASIDVLLEISAWKNRSKFLLVHVSPTLRDDGFEDLLEHAWAKQLLDFTLIELTDVRAPEKLIRADYSRVSAEPIIHQLNLFRKEYTRVNWNSSIEWFPDKVANMFGHPLKIGITHQPPFSFTRFDQYRKPVLVDGANIQLLNIIARMMNFTTIYQPRCDVFMEIHADKTPVGLYKLMRSGKIDIMAYLSPHYTTSMMDNTMRTATIRLDKLCPLIPVIPRSNIPFPINFFKAYIASFAIIAVFWFIKRALRFRGSIWRPFNLIRILFGVPVTRRPRKTMERIVFTFLLFVSAIYSSNIYVALTHISLQANGELEFQTFEDLEKSGLTPMMSSFVYNRTYHNAEGTLMHLKRKTILQAGGMHVCPFMAATRKNITCIMMYEEAKAWVRRLSLRSGGKVKITRPYFWSDSTGFLLGLASPYRARINEILGIVQSSGLLEKLYDGQITNIFNDPNDDTPEEKAGLDAKENMKTLRQQLLTISVVGYTLSLITLVAEIIVHQALKFKHRNS